MTATPSPAPPELAALVEIPVGSIGRDPDQPRKRFPEAELDELAESMKAEGVLLPITVTPNRRPDVEAPYLVLFGERRLLAALRAGLETVPCVVEAGELSPGVRLLRQIVENDQRAPLTLLDRAAGYVRARELSGLSDAEFCRRHNLSLSLLSRFRWVVRRQGLLREALDEDRIVHLETARLFDRLPALRQLRLLREARRTGEHITQKYVRRMIAAAESAAGEDDPDPETPEDAAGSEAAFLSEGSPAPAAVPATPRTRPAATPPEGSPGSRPAPPDGSPAADSPGSSTRSGAAPSAEPAFAWPASTPSRISIELVRGAVALEEAVAAGVLPARVLTDPDPPLLLRMNLEALDALLRRLGLDPQGEPGDRLRMLLEYLDVHS